MTIFIPIGQCEKKIKKSLVGWKGKKSPCGGLKYSSKLSIITFNSSTKNYQVHHFSSYQVYHLKVSQNFSKPP